MAFNVTPLLQAGYNPAPHLLKDEALARVAGCDEDDDCSPQDVLTQSASLHGAAANLVLQAQASNLVWQAQATNSVLSCMQRPG